MSQRKITKTLRSQQLRGIVLLAVVVLGALMFASAQTFTVIHDFTGSEGGFPEGALAIDRAGNIYGTTRSSNVYKLYYRGGWLLTPLYQFRSGDDGWDPHAGVVIGPDGTLFGTTWNGGGNGCTLGCGTIFNLHPSPTVPSSILAPWVETQLHRFQGSPDGQNPDFAGLIFDASGAAYGTTEFGGPASPSCSEGCGAVYKVFRSGGQWTVNILYAFQSPSDGSSLVGGVIFDDSGNLFGTTYGGGQYGNGTIYELTPSGGGWTKTTLYQFTGAADGAQPAASLVRDSAGNFFGSTTTGGSSGAGGTVFELSPSPGGWTFTVLYSFGRGVGPFGPLTMDSAGNLYGTTNNGGQFGFGTVFELSPSSNGWRYTALHNFAGLTDGGLPACPVLIAPDGTLYGTAYEGGNLHRCGRTGCGVIWQITR